MKKVIGLWVLLIIFSGSLVRAQYTTSSIDDEKAHEIVLTGTPDDVKKLVETGYDINKEYLASTLLITAVNCRRQKSDKESNSFYICNNYKKLDA